VAARPAVAGTEVAILQVFGERGFDMLDGFAAPGTILAVRRYNHPFLT
jgi:hypothetical protein